MPITRVQEQVLRAVLAAGALTTRRVLREYGPKPSWAPVLDDGWLREVHTVYGPVLAVTPRLREVNRVERAVADAPYLDGPTSLADRAYQMDALALLKAEGYILHRHEYKTSGKIGYQTGFTSQIVRTVLRVPPMIEARLRDDWGFVFEPRGNHLRIYPEVLGYPSLYATVSGGGIGPARVKALYRRHELQIHDWRHPLILAVPGEEGRRAVVRRLEAEWARGEEGAGLPRLRYPLIRLLVLPVPG